MSTFCYCSLLSSNNQYTRRKDKPWLSSRTFSPESQMWNYLWCQLNISRRW